MNGLDGNMTAEAGFYRVRLVRGGPWVAAEIKFEPPFDPETNEPLDRSFRHVAYFNGVRQDGLDAAEQLHKLVLFGEPISEQEHQFMLATVDWAVAHSPEAPEANPLKRVRLDKLPPLF